MKHVVTHHAYHKDEGVYRLIYAQEIETEEGLTYINPQDVIWVANDEQWKNMSEEEIATEQRRRIKEHLQLRNRETEAALERTEVNTKHFDDSAGQTL